MIAASSGEAAGAGLTTCSQAFFHAMQAWHHCYELAWRNRQELEQDIKILGTSTQCFDLHRKRHSEGVHWPGVIF